MLNPPFLYKFSKASRSPAVSKGGCVYYPLWLASATGVLQQAGHEVKLVDAPARGITMKQVEEIIKDWKPDMTVLDTVVASFFNDMKVAGRIKNVYEDTFLVVVGTHATARPEQVFEVQPKVDAVAYSEYDFTLRELAEKIEKKSLDLYNVKGVAFTEGKGKKKGFVKTDKREWITGEQLDNFKWQSKVCKEFLEVKDYFYPSVLYPEITIMTGRGCPFRCTFCMWPQTLDGHIYRARSPKNVVDELEYIKENFPEVRDIMIEDDTFTVHRPRVREICQEIIDRNLDVVWTCNARADVDYETLKIMKEAGCRLLCVGFESADQQILNNIKKGTNIQRIREFMQNTKKAEILVHGCFMLGNQGETKETVRKTIEFAKELDPDTAQFFPLMVYPGTESYDYFKEKGYLVTEDYNEWVNEEGDHNTLISRPGLTNKELVRLCDQARREFYMRPKFVLNKLKLAVKQPREIPRLVKAFPRFFKYLLQGTKI